MFKSKKVAGVLCCALAVACAGVSVSFAGCSKSNTHIYYMNPEYMGSEAYLEIVGDPSISEDDYDSYYNDKLSSEFKSLSYDASVLLSTLDRDLSTSLTDTELESLHPTEENTDEDTSTSVTYCVYRFNQASAGETVKIDEYTYDLLGIALDMYDATDGYYNPAVYYSVIAYGFGEQEETDADEVSAYPSSAEELPSAAEVAAYTELAGHFGEIKLSTGTDEKGSTAYYVTKPEYTVSVNGETLAMKIDLGGIGKGYATDKISALIDEYNTAYPGDFKYGYFTFGSSSVAVKQYYGDEENGYYTIGLTNPRLSTNAFAQFTGRNLVLSTSGDYEQYYRIDGVTYCHIINPKTGMPINTDQNDAISSNVVTITIAGGSAAEDDAYTTALMAMGGLQAINYINENLADRQFVMVINFNGRYAVVSNIDSLEIVSGIEGELE
ncbi:MAG: FAD:protein FMN transferase [Clostridia bacterium]|nr:FAD:protein FMN transferase [Clostridia bacterium]